MICNGMKLKEDPKLALILAGSPKLGGASRLLGADATRAAEVLKRLTKTFLGAIDRV